MASIEQSIEVDVPVRTAYNQWTQFEDFPRFMEGVESVRQLDDKRLQWRASVAGKTKEWQAEITEQRPDERIAWTSRGGAHNAGVVTFHRLADTRSKVMLQLDYDPEGMVENVGDAVGAVSLRVKGDLQRFKEFVESRGRETGAWRGEIDQGQVKKGRVA
jgi:uncharacterized membrane protein